MSAVEDRFRPEALLAAIRPHLPAALVSSRDFQKVNEIAKTLPACVMTLGLECRLIGNGPVDFGASISPANGGAAVLGGRTLDRSLQPLARGDKRWKRVREFATRWTDPRSRLGVRIPFIFLEFDADKRREPVPVPSVFLGLDWPIIELSSQGAERARRALRRVIDVAEKLRGRAFSAETRALARCCFDALPPRGLLLHAAVMVARPARDLRFSVLVPRAGIGGYLHDIGRADVASVVVQAIDTYKSTGGFPHPASHVQLDFDVGGSDRRMGLALCPPHGSPWSALLRKLVAKGLCQRSKAEDLLRWSGVSVEALEPSPAPRAVFRWLWHVKLVCTPEGVTSAKVYFGARLIGPSLIPVS